MSQTSRSRIIAAQRHRRGLARVIAMSTQRRLRESTLSRQAALDGRTEIILDGVGFDVHRAREYAKTLLALEVEQDELEGWTRARGKGPENREPGAFVSVEVDADWTEPEPGHHVGTPRRGGWPGKLAREWTGDRRAPMGRSLARLGRRLLEALEGQPSECQECAGSGGPGNVEWVQWLDESVDDQPGRRPPPQCCESCRGTGHNLAGALPPIEWSPAVKRNAVEAHDYALRRTIEDGWSFPPHLRLALVAGKAANVGVTRVVPRGEHAFTLELGQAPWEPEGSPRVHMYTPRGQTTEYPKRFRVRDLAPSWRRGEIRHAQQRRERDGLDELDAQAYDEFMAEVDDRGHWSPREAAE